jgi:hypothetical protein
MKEEIASFQDATQSVETLRAPSTTFLKQEIMFWLTTIALGILHSRLLQ